MTLSPGTQVDQECSAGALSSQQGAESPGASPGPAESTTELQPGRALQARLPSPIPRTASSLQVPDQLNNQTVNSCRRSTPIPPEGNNSGGQVSSSDVLDRPWYAGSDREQEDSSDESSDSNSDISIDSDMSIDLEEESNVSSEPLSDIDLGEEVHKPRRRRDKCHTTAGLL